MITATFKGSPALEAIAGHPPIGMAFTPNQASQGYDVEGGEAMVMQLIGLLAPTGTLVQVKQLEVNHG